MRFHAFDVSLSFIRLLRPIAARLRTVDPDLYRQLRKSASSVPLNLAEGSARNGKDRLHHYRVAEGSAKEAHATLLTAEAWGDLSTKDMAQALEEVDRLRGLLWKLTH